MNLKELYDIMSHFLDNAEDLDALIKMLRELDFYYKQTQNESKFDVSVIKKYLQMLSMEIHESIDELDGFLATRKDIDIHRIKVSGR